MWQGTLFLKMDMRADMNSVLVFREGGGKREWNWAKKTKDPKKFGLSRILLSYHNNILSKYTKSAYC